MGYTFSQLIFLILGVIYGITTCYWLVRLIHVRKFAADSYLAKYFYVLLIFQNMLSGASFFLLGLFKKLDYEAINQNDEKEHNRLFWTLILVPDALFIITYTILFWQLVKLFYEGHPNTADEIYLPNMRTKGIGYSIMYFVRV